MKDDDEFEKLLCEIPHATSTVSFQNLSNNNSFSNRHPNLASLVAQRVCYHNNFHHHTVDEDESIKCDYAFASSPVTATAFPLTSDDSTTSSFSGRGGRSHSNGSSSPPLFEPLGHKNANEGNFIDCLDFSRSFSEVSIQHCDQSDFGRYDRNGFSDPKKLSSALVGDRRAPQFYRANNGYAVKFMVQNVPQLSRDGNPNPNPNPMIGSERNLIHYQQSVGNGRGLRGVDSLMIPARRGRFHQDGYPSPKIHWPWKFSSLAEAQGYMYHMAMDQQGCRFLQRMFVEGTPRDVQIIFNEIIDHAVELMMTPFGNYLMQKLLQVCTEEQKMHILFKVTQEPGELVRISLNTYGTRVVQKLVETLKTKQQILMVISALEPDFLTLMKDLNGSHLIKRCLQCFPIEDCKFIFVAAAKYCVEIATHQNGCCALQSCIRYSTGEHRENFFAEISANGLHLAEDAYGNYVVQFILELEIPYATSKLTSQFVGNYVNLSTQKFSSHVVERCLLLCNKETRATIIHELLSASCFEQLLQDPYANYVIQTALRVSEGHLHYSLVDAIESYKAVSRNSPYSKKIFSQKLSKK